VCAWAAPTAAQSAQRDSRIDDLFSSDPATRGAAKADLPHHPDAALLPALLRELPSAQGTIQADLFESLAKYRDPRKITVFFAMHPWTGVAGVGQIDEQLSRLGLCVVRLALLVSTDFHIQRPSRQPARLDHLRKRHRNPYFEARRVDQLNHANIRSGPIDEPLDPQALRLHLLLSASDGSLLYSSSVVMLKCACSG
jgi:hypothetical protein